jgi:hypothetical protein
MIRHRVALALAATLGVVAFANAQEVTGSGTSAGGQAVPAADAVKAAQTQAIATLAKQRGIDAGQISVLRTEAKTWNDSSLGCARPGTAALQVISEGYLVTLSAAGHEYPVHVANGASVVCDRSVRAQDVRRALRVSGIDKAMQLSREDLAARLKVDPALIRVSNLKPAKWTDSALGCPRVNESVSAGKYNGFTMDLKINGQAFAYRADGTQARSCPPIENE